MPHTDRWRAGFGAPWVALGVALAMHVADEALTGFLDVYNPTVLALRERMPWWPMPVFTFNVWLGGLTVVVALELALSGLAFRNARWLRPVAWVLGVLMVFNAVGHTLGTVFGQTVNSVKISGAMPGFYSSPVLLAVSVWLLWRLGRTRPATN